LYPRLPLPDILRYHHIDSTFFRCLFLELVGLHVTASELFAGSLLEGADVIVHLVREEFSGEIPLGDQGHYLFDVLACKEFTEMHERQNCKIEYIAERHIRVSLPRYLYSFTTLNVAWINVVPIGRVNTALDREWAESREVRN